MGWALLQILFRFEVLPPKQTTIVCFISLFTSTNFKYYGKMIPFLNWTLYIESFKIKERLKFILNVSSLSSAGKRLNISNNDFDKNWIRKLWMEQMQQRGKQTEKKNIYCLFPSQCPGSMKGPKSSSPILKRTYCNESKACFQITLFASF